MGGSVQRYGGVHGHEHHARVDVYLLDAAPPHLDCLVVSQAVVDTLVELKYLNDEEFAEWFVRQRQLFRPRSAYVVRSELHRKVRCPEHRRHAMPLVAEFPQPRRWYCCVTSESAR